MDCPGQVELFTLHESLLNIVQTMTDKWHIRWALWSIIPLPYTFSTILLPPGLNSGELLSRDMMEQCKNPALAVHQVGCGHSTANIQASRSSLRTGARSDLNTPSR